MYTGISTEELRERRQHWFSKWCNDVDRRYREVYYNMYQAYDSLIRLVEIESAPRGESE